MVAKLASQKLNVLYVRKKTVTGEKKEYKRKFTLLHTTFETYIYTNKLVI